MTRIKLLPENLINRIAAGEVVERPASVLKELLENSLDAGATSIEVEIIAGGKKLIRVCDNGRGMSPDDMYMSLERHATSKIGADADLVHIDTLGFRGEALPSIASVSRLSVTSAEEGGEGHILSIAGGRLEHIKPAPANKGTTVEVADLFYNVPARRKFLKSENTESAHLLDIAQRYAMSCEGLRFVYRERGRELLSIDKHNDFRTRALRILGRQAAEKMKPFETEDDNLKIHGWLAGPETALKSTSNLFLYVLGRPVRDRLLTRALADGFGRILPSGRWPAAVIFVEIDPAEVDVNVHPAKAEVRFRQPERIFSALSRAVSSHIGQAPLGSGAFRPDDDISKVEVKAPQMSMTETNDNLSDQESELFANNISYKILGSEDKNSRPHPTYNVTDNPVPINENNRTSLPWMRSETTITDQANKIAPALPQETLSQDSSQQKYLPQGEVPLSNAIWPLAQLYNSYILAQGTDGLYIIDQHAAHERIIYNQLQEKISEEGLSSQRRLFPDTMDLTPMQALAAEKLESHLSHIGFELSHFGGSTFMLKAAPALLGDQDPWAPLMEILSAAQGHVKALEGAGVTEVLDRLSKQWLYSLACRAAIKAGYKMSLEEMAVLINDMAQAQGGGYCPHGRPAVFMISREYLEKKFDRR